MIDKNQLHQNGKSKDRLSGLFKEAHELDEQHTMDIGPAETEKAFQRVAKKAGIQTHSHRVFWKYIAAAVVLIIGIGLAFLLIPKQIQAPFGKVTTFSLPDGSTVTLNGGSKISYARWFYLRGRSVSINGEGYFNVVHTGSPFRVSAGLGHITVMGTKFDVRAWSTDANLKTTVFLQSGKVKFSSIFHKNKPVVLEPGDYSWISTKQPKPAKPKKLPSTKALAWMHQGLSFTDQPLSIIFHELTRRFGVKVITKPRSLANKKLTIYLSKVKNAKRPIADICRAKGLQYKKKGNLFIITKQF
jgi:ferric-dicitrate binding protein FerR (iron transport regulator)